MKIINIIVIVFMLFMLMGVFYYKSLVYDTISYSLNLWVHNLIPSMFPFFVISDILIHYRIIDYIPYFIKKAFCFLFNISDTLVMIFFLSCLSGFPSSARIISTLYKNNDISLDEANHALIFTHFSNPLFILSTVAVLFLHNESYGYIILVSHYLGNIILGILTRKRFMSSTSK